MDYNNNQTILGSNIFNPLKSERYYRNLDEQVLALITGEIGSMPDLKKPEDKPVQNTVHLNRMKKTILQ